MTKNNTTGADDKADRGKEATYQVTTRQLKYNIGNIVMLRMRYGHALAGFVHSVTSAGTVSLGTTARGNRAMSRKIDPDRKWVHTARGTDCHSYDIRDILYCEVIEKVHPRYRGSTH